MAAILKASFEVAASGADWAWNYCDPRTCHLYLSHGPTPMASIIAVYLYFVLSLGPKLMKNRQPFELRTVMLVYNAVQVLWCGYVAYQCYVRVWNPWGYSFVCQPLGMGMEPVDFENALVVYSFYLLKIVDLLDTVFMVLRKNFRQVSFLHVYHHAFMVLGGWLGTKGFPEGHHSFLGFINCIVHCVMYSYYFLTLYNPKMKMASWKKYITIMQIVQFGFNVVHESFPLLMRDCNVNKILSGLILVQNVYMFTLFSDFYVKTYIGKRAGKEKEKKQL